MGEQNAMYSPALSIVMWFYITLILKYKEIT